MLAPMLALIIISSLFDAISIGLCSIDCRDNWLRGIFGEDSFLTEITNYIIHLALRGVGACNPMYLHTFHIYIKKYICFFRVIFGTHLSNKLGLTGQRRSLSQTQSSIKCCANKQEN